MINVETRPRLFRAGFERATDRGSATRTRTCSASRSRLLTGVVSRPCRPTEGSPYGTPLPFFHRMWASPAVPARRSLRTSCRRPAPRDRRPSRSCIGEKAAAPPALSSSMQPSCCLLLGMRARFRVEARQPRRQPELAPSSGVGLSGDRRRTRWLANAEADHSGGDAPAESGAHGLGAGAAAAKE